MSSPIHLLIQLLSLVVAIFALPNNPHNISEISRKDKVSIVERNGRNLTTLEHEAAGAKLEFVTNSGICETTPGVNQYSGYISLEPAQHTWFWLFEARNNARTAPLAAWFGGGPGCSSTSALFNGNGPCRFLNNESTPSLNPDSWNNNVNMLYIDQPYGAGFSYSTQQQRINTTDAAAALVWKFIQTFYDQFPQYESRDFGIWSESYGGHSGPGFADYFDKQNAGISKGLVSGTKVKLIALGLNNGWYDSIIQIKSLIDFSYSNSYKQIINATAHEQYTLDYQRYCIPQLEACRTSQSDSFCLAGLVFCITGYSGSIQDRLTTEADFDIYDIRLPSISPEVEEVATTHEKYLWNPAVMAAIGARSNYTYCSAEVNDDFSTTGDVSITYLPNLSGVVNAGINTVVFAGDADWVCNWMGNKLVSEAVHYPGQAAFKARQLGNYSVDGVVSGTFKMEGNLAFLRVFGAGHGVSWDKPKVALQVFEQMMKKEGLRST